MVDHLAQGVRLLFSKRAIGGSDAFLRIIPCVESAALLIVKFRTTTAILRMERGSVVARGTFIVLAMGHEANLPRGKYMSTTKKATRR